MSGILYAQEQDYKTGYSYFYEALEPLMYICEYSVLPTITELSTVSSTWSCARLWIITKMMFTTLSMASLDWSIPGIPILLLWNSQLMHISSPPLWILSKCSRPISRKSKEIKLWGTTQKFFMIDCSRKICSRSLSPILRSILLISAKNYPLVRTL